MIKQKIEDIDFVIFDVETTGLLPKDGDRIVEIGALRYKNGEARESFSSLLNPRRPLSPGPLRLTASARRWLKTHRLPRRFCLNL